ncbi:MAG: pseudoazurin [Gammaproteobacteria bacterium]
MHKKLALGALALAAASLIAANAYAKTYTVKELNSGAGGTFVFEPDFLHIQPGDSVQFVPADPGHDVQSYFVPKGAEGWKGEISQGLTVKLTKEGVYLYDCSPHYMFGMQGVIVVGKATNKEEAEKAAKAMEAKQIMNKDRLEKLMHRVK